jgi:hypothetical protein
MASLAGEMLTIHDLTAAHEKAIGRQTCNRAIDDLLARHDWRKPMPSRFYPERRIGQFKKIAFQMPCGKPGVAAG